ncbi:MAG: hypothetical protein ACO1NW_13655 [Chitinophagaceae bacterium]
MKVLVRICCSLLLMATVSGVWAQTSDTPAMNILRSNPRILWHDKIDEEQKKALALGKTTDIVKVSEDESINLQVTDALIRKVDRFQDEVEADSTLDHRLKVKYLRGMEDVLRLYNTGWQDRSFKPALAPELVAAYFETMKGDKNGENMTRQIAKYPYTIGNLLIRASSFIDNPGLKESGFIVFRKYCALYPNEVLPRLRVNSDYPFTDSLIIAAAHRDPKKLYDYAAAGNKLGSRIRNVDEPLVRTVSQLATSRSGQLYFPFLDNLYHGKITLDQVDKAAENDETYYKLLVKTQIEYAGRLPERDTPMEMQALTDMLGRKGKQVYVSQINALHDSPDAIRFRILQSLTPEELYYLAVLGEDEIYTSSYTNGVYKLIFQKMAVPRGDSLLMRVNFDHFRKFIKMSAGYNTLDHFLGTMEKDNAIALMRAFALRLEKTRDMEDPVDVADSYGSIRNEEIKAIVLREIKQGYASNRQNGNKKGEVIYNILETLFASSDTSQHVDLSAKLGIPPVYNVSYKSLSSDSGAVIQQVFFYGDKDGIDSYANFMGMFRGNPNWKVVSNKQWVEISSTRGKPVRIFANLPLDNDTDQDAKAQHALSAYMSEKGLSPTIVVHRGHSYHVKYTIAQLAPSARVVILGSCGGYHNLDQVLDISPDAHIISSKQVGTRVVNEPILQSINECVRSGKNIEWISMWGDLASRVKDERFEDYIPPHKNLGAIFIKAYKKAMGEE